MATNDFLPFSVGSGANVLSQAAYAALAALGPGFASGVAQSAACNKVWRQSSIMASVIAQLIVANTGQNATDDGTTATLLANLQKAVSGRLLGVTVISASGTFTPNPLATKTRVRGSGGGAAGGGAAATGSGQVSIGSGGGCGAYAEILITTAIPAPISVTVGSGGTGVSGAAGNSGGSSTFGSYLTLPGGPGGTTSNVTTPPLIWSGANNGSAPTVTGATTIIALPSLGGGGAFALAASGAGTISPGRGVSNQLGGAGLPTVGPGSGSNGVSNIQSSSAIAGITGLAGGFIVEEYA